jgi:hypothetical protein
MGASSFGFGTVWLNRARMPNEYEDLPPLREISELATLPTLDY